MFPQNCTFPWAVGCPGGIVVRALDLRLKRSPVRLPAVLLSGNNLGQVVHTHVPLSPSYLVQRFPGLPFPPPYFSLSRVFHSHIFSVPAPTAREVWIGLPDLPYFTGDPVFQPRSPASRKEAARDTESPVFDYRLIQIGRIYKLCDSNLHHAARCPKA